MSITWAAKRMARELTAPLPWATRRGLMRSEVGRGHVEVPIGDGVAHVLADSHRIDHYTLYGAVIDRHFPCDVAGAAVLDVGAHKGYFALRCLADGAARVDSYEPASQNLEALRRSAAGIDTWRVLPCAVGAEAGSVVLHLSPGSWAHSVHEPVGGQTVGTEGVTQVALSAALAEISALGLPVVAKINVEGAAGEMILGTAPADWVAVRLLWIDVEVNDPVGVDRIAAHLTDCGLRHERRDGGRHLFVR